MKVLLLSVFHPELVRGGAQQVAWELFQGLRETPDTQAVFLAATDQSLPALYKTGACITGFDGCADEYLFLANDVDPWWHKSSDPRLVEAYADFLRRIRPDVVHFHHFMRFGIELLTLTRRVLPACRIIFTLHEFLAICAADGHMLRWNDGSLCERASPARCRECLPQRPAEQFVQREAYMKAHLRAVDMFAVPGRFMRRHYERWGLPPHRIAHIANGLRPPAGPVASPSERRPRNRFGFFGQLVDVKGVWLLLQAVGLLRADGFTDFSVEINGDNLRFASPERRAEIERFIAAEEARSPADRIVRFTGAYHAAEIGPRMAGIDWCVVPSVWWESFALVISEAWAFGKPVIAGDAGGPAERVTHEEDGLLFRVGNARALADTLRRAATEPDLWNLLAAGITPPPTREDMVRQYLALYTGDSAVRLSA